jgi:hypothetical protein
LDDRKPAAMARQGRAKRVGAADKPLTDHRRRQKERLTQEVDGAICRGEKTQQNGLDKTLAI